MVFGMLQKAVFQDSILTVTSKRLVYLSIVLGVLQYGSKKWTIKSRTRRKLETFHNRTTAVSIKPDQLHWRKMPLTSLAHNARES